MKLGTVMAWVFVIGLLSASRSGWQAPSGWKEAKK
jgi:hypothetical protein